MTFYPLRLALFISLFLLAFFAISTAHAQSPPIPANKNEVLLKNEAKAEATKLKKQQLESKIKEIKAGLKNTKTKLVDIAQSIQKNESELAQTEEEIKEIEGNAQALKTKLNKDHARISNLILVLERIRRVPPEALMVKPESSLKTVQTILLLQDIIPVINAQASEYKSDLMELSTLTIDLESKRDRLKEQSEKMESEQKSLNDLIAQREQLFASTQADYEKTQERLRRISEQSRNLRELVSRIGEENERLRKNNSVKQAALPALSDLRSGVQLPISGAILIAYGEPDRFGADSVGITIEGRGGGLVTAPMSGIVRFSGDFKHYGNMVIIEHDGEYHSLIAGLGRLDVTMGQPVNVGEPVGILKKAVNGKKPGLYYELRYKGKAIHPAKKFSGLG